MAKSIERILIEFTLEEISFWEVIAWAHEVDGNEAANEVALTELRYMDEAVIDRKKAIGNLLNLIPNSDNETLPKILLKEHLDRIASNKIKPSKFVEFIVESVQAHENSPNELICSEIYKIFNAYNGFGFDQLESMDNNELLTAISDLLNNQQRK